MAGKNIIQQVIGLSRAKHPGKGTTMTNAICITVAVIGALMVIIAAFGDKFFPTVEDDDDRL